MSIHTEESANSCPTRPSVPRPVQLSLDELQSFVDARSAAFHPDRT